MRQQTYETALQKCAALCARAEHSAFEIRKKLYTWKMSKADIERIIAYLYSSDFLNDCRFAEAFINDKARFDGWGRIKIRFHLKQHGIASEVIDEAMEVIDEEEYISNMRMMLQQKNKLLREPDVHKRKQALARFATSRGFESSLFLPMLSEIMVKEKESEE